MTRAKLAQEGLRGVTIYTYKRFVEIITDLESASIDNEMIGDRLCAIDTYSAKRLDVQTV